MKLKRKLLYSILLFTLSFSLLLAITLGWFHSNQKTVLSPISFYYSGVAFSLSKSADDNHDGVPDKDEENQTIYQPISSENIEISNLFPLARTEFKMDVSAGTRGGYFNVSFLGISAPSSPETDVADVLRIQYTDPITLALIDKPLSELMDENRDITLYTGYHITGTGDFMFSYTVYMDSQAGNEYKNKALTIDKALFFVSQNPIGGN